MLWTLNNQFKSADILWKYFVQLVSCYQALLNPNNDIFNNIKKSEFSSSAARASRVLTTTVSYWQSEASGPTKVKEHINHQNPAEKGDTFTINSDVGNPEVVILWARLGESITDFSYAE